ncbi:uncharacterized protein LOC110068092 isoform X2 [Orbicella faveolata]|uniref:uncharacterized protein LOC110068092 isoform X2 n=1 Tax=Orbicella faveolata TaxID=48498 RepID=UPI0009E584BA|nr:uncharacterized protein LOC110068092 isoform X2 [Orbicella faveolata]
MRTLRTLTLQLTLLLAGVVSSRTSTPRLRPSKAEAGFQLATSASVSTLKIRPSSGDTSFQRTSSFAFTPTLRSSPSTTDFQTASLVASTLTLRPSSGATDWQLANFSASVLRFSPSSRTTGIQISSCSTPEIPPGITGSGYTPRNYSPAGTPLPLLAKILIPVAGVLLIVLVMFTWYCCVRKKESGDRDDLMIESTVMVRFEPEDHHSSA